MDQTYDGPYADLAHHSHRVPKVLICASTAHRLPPAIRTVVSVAAMWGIARDTRRFRRGR